MGRLYLIYVYTLQADIAGYVMFTNISETKEEDYDRFVNVNQKAKFFLAQLCLPYLKETKGLLVWRKTKFFLAQLCLPHLKNKKVCWYEGKQIVTGTFNWIWLWEKL